MMLFPYFPIVIYYDVAASPPARLIRPRPQPPCVDLAHLQPAVDHSVDRVATTATHTNDLDACIRLIWYAWGELGKYRQLTATLRPHALQTRFHALHTAS
eukprot:533339-Pyramimonas_sp.AAC.3